LVNLSANSNRSERRPVRWLASSGILAVHIHKCALDRECGSGRAFSVVFLRPRVAKQRHEPVAQLLGDVAAHLSHRRRRLP